MPGSLIGEKCFGGHIALLVVVPLVATRKKKYIYDCRPGYGGLGLSIEGPSKVDINCEDVEDGTCRVTYCPTEPGSYIINIKFADQHVPGMAAEVTSCRVDRG